MIPKKIHYVWVGDNPKSELVLKCIESWKKHLPDYEIIEWGNDAIKLINNQYINEAFKNKKWAFVSDVIRLYALYTEGGIYLDTDVQVTDSFNNFLHHDFFSCYELHNNQYSPIVTAVMGAQPKNTIVKDLLAQYNESAFIIKGQFDLRPNTVRVTNYFAEKFNLQAPYNGEETTYITDNSVIFPYYYFCTPKHCEPNYAIHLFDGSWIPGFARRNKLSLGKLHLARFKRVADNELLDIGVKDKILFSFKVSNNIQYALVLNY